MRETKPIRACTAQTRSGTACKGQPILGGHVCRMHGGGSPQVKAKAEERLAEFVDPALSELRRIMGAGESDAVRLAAVKDILDRAGYKPREKIDQTLTVGATIYLPERKPIV